MAATASSPTSPNQVRLAPPPVEAPECFLCHQRSSTFTTRSSNRNGNAGRPYHKCVPCRKFLCFADDRGNDLGNPNCDCGVSSKTQVAGLGRLHARGLHYVCRLGKCDFYLQCRDQQGREMVATEDVVGLLARLKII